MRATLLLSSALLVLSACEQTPPPAAKPAASDFYQAYLSTAALGVPTAEQRANLAPWLSPALLALLSEAEAAEVRHAAANSGEPQPPLVQGDLFSSLFEGATGVEVKACKEIEQSAACDIRLSYAPAGQTPAHWQDILLLVWTDAGWRVDDIEYGGDWPFGNKGTLRQNLHELLQTAPK